jgi:hypothetical protein
MRASALLTCLLLSAGVASAEAPPTSKAADTKPETEVGRVSLEESKESDTPRAPSQWLELADPTPAKHGTEFIVVGAQQGSFSRLRVDAAKGRTVVKHVRVDFSDGSRKTYKVGKTVTKNGRKFAEIDLGVTKPIAQIAVTTDRQTKGEYALYGSSGGGTGTAVSSR